MAVNVINIQEVKLKQTVEQILKLESLAKQIKTEITELETEIKDFMITNELEETYIGSHLVKFQNILSQRLDSTKLKKELPSVYTSYLKQVSSSKFSIK